LAGRTNTEKIDELIEAVAKLKGNVEALSKFVDSIEKDIDEMDVPSMRERLKGLEVKLEHLEKQRTEEHGRTWAIKLAIASAVIGSVFTILTQLLSIYLRVK